MPPIGRTINHSQRHGPSGDVRTRRKERDVVTNHRHAQREEPPRPSFARNTHPRVRRRSQTRPASVAHRRTARPTHNPRRRLVRADGLARVSEHLRRSAIQTASPRKATTNRPPVVSATRTRVSFVAGHEASHHTYDTTHLIDQQSPRATFAQRPARGPDEMHPVAPAPKNSTSPAPSAPFLSPRSPYPSRKTPGRPLTPARPRPPVNVQLPTTLTRRLLIRAAGSSPPETPRPSSRPPVSRPSLSKAPCDARRRLARPRAPTSSSRSPLKPHRPTEQPPPRRALHESHASSTIIAPIQMRGDERADPTSPDAPYTHISRRPATSRTSRSDEQAITGLDEAPASLTPCFIPR
jgi:hypothetical protein